MDSQCLNCSHSTSPLSWLNPPAPPKEQAPRRAARFTSGSCAFCRTRSSAASIRSARDCRPRARYAGASRSAATPSAKRCAICAESGLVSPRQGSGTTVAAATPSFYVHPVASVTELMQYAVATRYVVAGANFVVADTRLARRLGCSPGRRWLHTEGLRYAPDGSPPICWTEVYVHAAYAGVRSLIGKRTGPIYTWIEEMYDERVVEVVQTMRAVTVPTDNRGQAQGRRRLAGTWRSSGSTNPPNTASSRSRSICTRRTGSATRSRCGRSAADRRRH